MVFNQNGKLYEFSSNSMDATLHRYSMVRRADRAL